MDSWSGSIPMKGKVVGIVTHQATSILTLCSGDGPCALSISASSVLYVSLHSALLKGSKIVVTKLDPSSSAQLERHTFSSVDEHVRLHIGGSSNAPVLVWTENSNRSLKINVLGSKHVTSASIAHHDAETIQDIVLHGPKTMNARPHFLVHYQTSQSNWAEVYHIDASAGTAAKAYDLPQLGGKGAFSTSTLDANVYFTRNTDFEVSIVSSASHGVLERWPVHPKSHGGLLDPEGILSAVSEVVPKGKSNLTVRSAVVLPSGDWVLVRNGDPAWVRPEGLAGVVAAGWAEIPLKENLAKELAIESHKTIFSAYIHRVSRHIGDLKHFPRWSSNLPFRLMGNLLGDKSGLHSQSLERDGFGFHKLVIVVTEKGRVMALDTGAHGRILWNTQAFILPLDSKWNVSSIDVGDELTKVMTDEGEFIYIENLTGKISDRGFISQISTADTLVTSLSEAARQIVIKLDHNSSPSIIEGELGEKRVMVTQKPGEAILGWTFKNNKASLAWEFSVPSDETMSTITTRPRHDPVASIGKALGDRNVLYKYLNPNLAIITSISPAKSQASIHLIDCISGENLHTATHYGIDTSKAIRTTISENWFTYSLYSDPLRISANTSDPLPKGYQLIISELYESPILNDRGPLGPAENFSSLYSPKPTPPYVISQSYVIPGPISYLSTTSTLQGITPRSILCVLPSISGLLSVPLAVLSARRPAGRDPSPADVEEGLFKYQAYLDFNPQWIISHQREIIGLKHVISSPSLMESTSLVFAYGDVDVFGTRVAPIGSFDVLGKGFSQLQLIGSVVALGIGTGVLAPMVSHAAVSSVVEVFHLADGCCRRVSDKSTGCGGVNRAFRSAHVNMSGYTILVVYYI